MLEDAKLIAQELKTAARQRTVISRAYYAAYSASLAMTNFRFDNNARMGVHAQLINNLLGSTERKEKFVGRRLDSLRGKRVIADYQLGAFMSSNMAREAIEDAEEIIVDLWEITQ